MKCCVYDIIENAIEEFDKIRSIDYLRSRIENGVGLDLQKLPFNELKDVLIELNVETIQMFKIRGTLFT